MAFIGVVCQLTLQVDSTLAKLGTFGIGEPADFHQF